MGRKRRSKDGVEATTPSAPPTAVPLKPKPLGVAAITPAKASAPDPPPGSPRKSLSAVVTPRLAAMPPEPPPEGIPREVWDYCLLGHRVIDRTNGNGGFVKPAASAQIQDDPVYKGRKERFAVVAWNIATRLRADDWARLGNFKTRLGMPLNKTHLTVLAQNEDRKIIESLLEGLVRERWTSQEMEDKLHALNGGGFGEGSKRVGRARTAPKTLKEGLEALTRHSEDWLKDHDFAAQGRNAWLGLPSAGNSTEESLDRLVQAKGLLRRLMRAARELETRVHDLEGKVRDGGGGSAP